MKPPKRPGTGRQDVIRKECQQMDRELDALFPARDAGRPAGGLPESALAHLRHCERCGRLYQWLLEDAGTSAVSPAAVASARARLKQTLRPVTPQAPPRVLAAQFLLVFLLFSAPMIGMMGTTGLQVMNAVQLLGVLTVLVCGAALLSFSLAWQMSPGSLHRVPPRTAVVVLIAGFLAAMGVLFPWREPQAFLEHGWSCLKGGAMMAMPSGVLFWLMARRGHTLASGVLGATLGAMAGLLGASVLQFECDRGDAAHLVAWHGGVVVFSMLLGVAVSWCVSGLFRRRT